MDKDQLDNDALAVLVDARIRDSISWFDSKLSKEREEVARYYNGELPKRQSEGNSSYVSTDVYDAVEAMKAQLLETFAAGYDIVRFDPQNERDVEAAKIATTYTDYVLFRQNNGYSIFNDVIHDGLVARAGVAKVYWDEKFEYEEEEINDLHPDEVDGLLINDTVDSLNVEADDATGMFGGKLTRKYSKSQVRIEVVNPEEFFIEPQAQELSEDYFCGQRFVKTLAELEQAGYDIKKLKEYNFEHESSLSTLPERLARFQNMDSGFRPKNEYDDPSMRPVLVYECYLKTVLKEEDESDTPKLWKVVRCADVTLDIQEVDELPFVAFVPLPIPHSFYGNNFAKLVIPSQKARTVLMRGILDHTAITNNPRYMVLKGGLTNPRELLDNRLGGIVNTTRPDAVLPLPQASLNPFVYQTLELVKANTEETTGISSLSQGLNKDAVSKQNSAAMVENLVSLSQTRQKIIARNFANQFLIPLFTKIYNLVIRNEDKRHIIETAGNWVEVDPRQWMERRSAVVSMHLGYGEQEREAMKYAQLLAMASQDPQLSEMVTGENRYNIATTVLKLQGMKDVANLITHPSKVPPKQPDPMVVKQMQQADRQLDIQDKAATAQLEKVAIHKEIEQMKLAMDAMQEQVKTMLAERDADRKDADIANKIDIAQREMKLAEEAPMPEDAGKAIVSPNS